MADEVKFVKVSKGGDVLEVHPDMLEQHLKLGWVQVPEEAEKTYSKAELDKAVKAAVEKALAAKAKAEGPKPRLPMEGWRKVGVALIRPTGTFSLGEGCGGKT